jgi:chromosome segregation protein
MRLKSLEMTGFKSFSGRTVLSFPAGITAIVGPNGCGKSNVVDALRWVMGEQSVRHLRGRAMEDVIFNGSETQAATGMAEVSLVLDNRDGQAPAEYASFTGHDAADGHQRRAADGQAPAEYASFTEIMITRRLFRSGESEYLINKVPCRLKDIIEFFLGTGVGNKAYAIVEQGRVDEMINAKPEERRSFIEEAAGTSKYRNRKLIAERKLDRTQQNLLRVNDIVREVERQIRSLEMQAKKAERYRLLKSELREKELAWAALQHAFLDREIDALEKNRQRTEDRLTELLAALHGRESAGESGRLTMLEADREIQATQELLYQAKLRQQGADQRIAFCEKEQASLRAADEKVRREISQAQEKIRSLTSEIDGLKRERDEFSQLLLFEEDRLHDGEKRLVELKDKLQRLQSEVDGDKDYLIDAASRLAQWRNDLSGQERRVEEIGRERAKRRDEETAARSTRENWSAKRDEASAGLQRCGVRAAEIDGENNRSNETLARLKEARAEQEKTTAATEARLQQARSRLLSLQELRKNYEGYHEGVKAIMLRRDRQPKANGIYGLVADVLEAPEPYEKALTAVLGDRLQCLIVESHAEGLESIEYLKRESSGRGSFLPLSISQKRLRPLPSSKPEVVAPLLDMVAVKDGFREIAEYLLGDVVVVKDLKTGLALWSRNGFVCTLVTPEGEVIDHTGVITGGSTESLEAGLLAQKRRIKELENLTAQLAAELRGEKAKLAALDEEIASEETKRAALLAEGHQLELDRLRLDHEIAQASREIARAEEMLAVLKQEETDLAAGLAQLETEMKTRREAVAALEAERGERERAFNEKREQLARAQRDLETLESEVTNSRVRGTSLEEKRGHAEQNLERRVAHIDELRTEVAAAEIELSEIEKRTGDLNGERETARAALAESAKVASELEERVEGERRKYRDLAERVARVEEEIKKLRSDSDAIQEEKNRLDLLLTEKRIGLQHLCDGIREKYDVDLRTSATETPAGDVPPSDLAGEVEELKRRLDRMGDVNLTAIGEFEELSGRYAFLTQQKDDLEKSVADLQQTIAKLNRTCRQRFRETFDEINRNFEEIFPRLFRGGRARLVLTNESDYLETGVDIIAQPPGKKLQSITLLSGGEKALTAVSLLFALFLTKPSPFCCLDEVDAPLDDANIDRFNEIVKEMSQSSQFILITHNKRTMQAAEVLYGITMEEPGLSKVVSVRMN